MDGSELAARALGVYAATAQGPLSQVHSYAGGDHSLRDVVDEFSIGCIESAGDDVVAVALSRSELQRLKASADAYSFDYDAEFIELCLALHRYAQSCDADRIVFYANYG